MNSDLDLVINELKVVSGGRETASHCQTMSLFLNMKEILVLHFYLNTKKLLRMLVISIMEQ